MCNKVHANENSFLTCSSVLLDLISTMVIGLAKSSCCSYKPNSHDDLCGGLDAIGWYATLVAESFALLFRFVVFNIFHDYDQFAALPKL